MSSYAHAESPVNYVTAQDTLKVMLQQKSSSGKNQISPVKYFTSCETKTNCKIIGIVWAYSINFV